MKKMTSIFLFFLGISSTTLFAQQTTLPAGGDASGSGGSISYSVGQVFYTTATGSSQTSTTGVQQPYEFYISVDRIPSIRLSMKAFPNPTTSTVNLSIGEVETEGLKLQLFDATGKFLLDRIITDKVTTVPMQNLVPATYYLNVTQDNQIVKTFTIIKNQ